MTARGLITAADELQNFLVEQLNFPAAGLLIKRGISLLPGEAQVSSAGSCAYGAGSNRGYLPRRVQEQWETWPAERKSPVFPQQLFQRDQWGLGEWRLVRKEVDQGLKTSSWKSGSLSFSIPWNQYKERKKDFITSVRYPKEAFFGVQSWGSVVCQQLFCNMGTSTHKMTTPKMWVSGGAAKQVFFIPLTFAISSCSLLSLQSHRSDYSFGWSVLKMIMLSLILTSS